MKMIIKNIALFGLVIVIQSYNIAYAIDKLRDPMTIGKYKERNI